MNDGYGLAMALRRSYLAMHRQANARFSKLGLTADQFVLLNLLAQEDGITQRELVERSFSDPNTVRAMLVLLEGQELILREPHPTDARARCVLLTKKGRRLHAKAWEASADFHQLLQDLIRPAELRTLLETLQRVEQGIVTATPQRT